MVAALEAAADDDDQESARPGARRGTGGGLRRAGNLPRGRSTSARSTSRAGVPSMADSTRTPVKAAAAFPSRMAATDAIFWYVEEAVPQYRSTIAGLYVLKARPDPERLDAALDAAIAEIPRLRQRVLEVPFGLGLPEWVEDPHFDRRYHLRHVSVAPPGDDRHRPRA